MNRDADLSIGIRGLEAPLGRLVNGGVYALSMPPTLLDSCLAGLGREAAVAKRRLCLIEQQPESTARLLAEQGWDLLRAQRAGSLRLYRVSADMAASINRLGPMQWLDELDHFGIPRGAVVVVSQAEALFDWSSQRAAAVRLRLYVSWARAQDVALLLLFPSEGLGTDRARELAAMGRLMSGGARLISSGPDLLWETHRWRGHLRQPAVCRLRQNEDGSLRTHENDAEIRAEWTRRIAAAADRDQVLITEAALLPHRAPAQWQQVLDVFELEQRAASALAATLVLDLTDVQQYRNLAHLVYRLRSQHGRGLCILVRERGLRLRQAQKQLLQALGANQILDSSTTHGELLAQVESQRGDIFMRSMFPSFETAFLSAMPTAAGGYQHIPDFLDQVRPSMARAQASGLECAMVRFFLLPNVSPLDALRQVRTVRPGDFCTADDHSVYLFLFACWQDDIDAAIERVVRRPVEQLFEGQIRSAAMDAIRSELRDLESRAREQAGSDYGPALAGIAPSEPLAPTPETPARLDARRSGRRVRAAPLALRAESGA